jgi:hypothetical protein
MKKYAPLIAGVIAFAYYTLLCSKQWTWVFMSGDSGDWLTASSQWLVPQPYGSPLYLLLLRLFDSSPAVLTILLSCLPSAVTVGLVYATVRKLTGRELPAIVSSAVLLGCSVFLTQSTVLEEYALAVMLLTLSYWLYINDRKKLCALCLGLATAVHMFVLPIAIFWLILNYKEWKLKPVLIYTATVAAFYSAILVLMYLPTPHLITGPLTLTNAWSYFTTDAGAVVGTLALTDAPVRLLTLIGILAMSFGLALAPVWYGLKRPYDKSKLILLAVIVFSFWYYATSLDPSTWTFLCFAAPPLAILCGTSLGKLALKHSYCVLACACVLVLINGVFLNAGTLTKAQPLAQTYYNELMSLPDGTAVVCDAGGYGFGLFYVISEGKDLCPIVTQYADNKSYYREYVSGQWSVGGSNADEMIADAIKDGRNVHYVD